MATIELPLVSVIVTTKNEEKNIENCLRSIQEQTYSNLEIIVVDNASADKTIAIAERFSARVFDKGPERSAQRNFGVDNSSGTFILYLDADMILSPNVVSECVSKISSNPKLVALFVPENIVGSGFWIAVRQFERSFYTGSVIDCVRFVRKDTFLKSGGFDSNLCGPEDWDFDKRIRALGDVAVIESPLFHNEGEFELSFYLKKKSYYSVSMSTYTEKWGKDDPDIKKQLGLLYRYFYVFVENKKFLHFFRHPILMIGMYYLRFRVGWAFLKSKYFRSRAHA